MKKICLVSILAVAFIFSGCTKNNNGTGNDASVLFVDGCAGTGSVDVKVNGSTISGTASIGYFVNSGYQYVTANSALAINFYLLNQGTLLCNSTQNFTAKEHYSVFAGGLVTGASFVVTTDDLPTLTTGNAGVRFINLSSDSLNESFFIGSAKLDSNIGYTTCTPFYQIAATTGVLVLIQDPDYPTYLAELTSQAFSAGKIYTIMLTGSHTSAAGSQSVLKLTVINNN